MSLFHLFWIFFYIGLFAIGGGLVCATFMQQILVEQYGLISSEKFYSMLAISESTPGPIGINLATYVGTELYGVGGGIVTTFGEVLPSFIVIVIIAKFFSKFQDNVLVQNVMKTLRPVTTGMVLVALINVFTVSIINVNQFSNFSNFWNVFTKIPLNVLQNMFDVKILLFYFSCILILAKTKLHPIVIIILGAVFGVVFL